MMVDVDWRQFPILEIKEYGKWHIDLTDDEIAEINVLVDHAEELRLRMITRIAKSGQAVIYGYGP